MLKELEHFHRFQFVYIFFNHFLFTICKDHFCYFYLLLHCHLALMTMKKKETKKKTVEKVFIFASLFSYIRCSSCLFPSVKRSILWDTASVMLPVYSFVKRIGYYDDWELYFVCFLFIFSCTAVASLYLI